VGWQAKRICRHLTSGSAGSAEGRLCAALDMVAERGGGGRRGETPAAATAVHGGSGGGDSGSATSPAALAQSPGARATSLPSLVTIHTHLENPHQT